MIPFRAICDGGRDDGAAQPRSGTALLRFHFDEMVPDDHLVRKVGVLLDLSWAYSELAPYYSALGRPSID